MNRNRRPRKTMWRRDYMAEAIREHRGTEFGRYLAERYPELKVRLGFNDDAEHDPTGRRD